MKKPPGVQAFMFESMKIQLEAERRARDKDYDEEGGDEDG